LLIPSIMLSLIKPTIEAGFYLSAIIPRSNHSINAYTKPIHR
jgi:hypothetical protein